jgi:hypothetical protein
MQQIFHPIYWEQKAIFYLFTPVQAVMVVVYLVLTPIYLIFSMLRLPMTVLTLAMSVVWFPLMLVIVGCGKASRRMNAIRPLSFIAAFPFLLIGHMLVSLEPVLVPGDEIGKAAKLMLIEQFPIFPVDLA